MAGCAERASIRLLGRVAVTGADGEFEPPPRTWGLVVALALRPQGFEREELARIVAPELERTSARRRLSRLLWLLRDAVPDLALSITSRRVTLPADAREVDVEQMLASARSEAADDLELALQGTSGALAQGCDLPWVVERRREVTAAVRDAIAKLASWHLAADRPAEAIRVLAPRQAEYAGDGELLGLRLRAHLALGERAQGLAALDRWCEQSGLEEERLPPHLRELVGQLRGERDEVAYHEPRPTAPPHAWQAFAHGCGPRGDRRGQNRAIGVLRQAVTDGTLSRDELRLVEIDRALDEHALALAERLLAMADADSGAVAVRRARLALLSWRLDEAVQEASRALVDHYCEGEREARVAALLVQAAAHSRRADKRDAIASAQEAHRAARDLGRADLELAAELAHGRELLRQGRFAQALDRLDPAGARAEELGLARVELDLRHETARARCRLGELDIADVQQRDLRQRWAELGYPAREAAAASEHAYTLIRAGRIAEALEATDDARDLAERGGSPEQHGWACFYRALALTCRDGMVDASWRAALVATERADVVADPGLVATSRLLIGLLDYLADRPGEALESLHEARERYTSRDEFDHLPLVLAIEGLAHLARGEVELARDATARGLREIAQLGASDFAVGLHYAHARVLEACDRPEEAGRWLSRGNELLREIAREAGLDPMALAARDPLTRALTAAAAARTLDDTPASAARRTSSDRRP
ncbi:hypothetical protein ER308_11675 [Egibacter rhizosphaerae]|uniref:Bacterial transcriptional activator domain-containing protein n=1 Tax=Egibacter rhizosphaerae TaxID=1670831 RepID=A0A411YG37_9ACTN|nr:hypothetical protein [Egibacter rhizosphaerae]QBI20156.1 hypothetical protein ER308_11675 [Egibacter rhizosphaerae]